MNNTEILYKPFDINTHAKEFYNYLEVIIRPNGTIEYAVPSHQEKLTAIFIEMFGIETFRSSFPRSAMINYMQWLVDNTCCVSVWNNFIVKPLKLTAAQRKSLKLLASTEYTHGSGLKLYQGEI